MLSRFNCENIFFMFSIKKLFHECKNILKQQNTHCNKFHILTYLFWFFLYKFPYANNTRSQFETVI